MLIPSVSKCSYCGEEFFSVSINEKKAEKNVRLKLFKHQLRCKVKRREDRLNKLLNE